MTTPKCKKCGEPCQLYGGVGGYSVCCKACNEKAAEKRRKGRIPKVLPEPLAHKSSFLEIIPVNNGSAVYDFSVRQYDIQHDRKALPMLVFNSKREMTEWICLYWEGVPYDPLKS